MGYFTSAGLFLIEFVFGLYIVAVLLRFLLQIVRADFYNPIAQFLVAITNPVVKPLRRITPGLFGVDMASLIALILLAGIEWSLISLLQSGGFPRIAGLVVFVVADLLKLTIWVFTIALIARVVMSWVNPYGAPNPAGSLAARLTEPLMRPARNLLPAVSGIDFSPIVVFLLLGLAQILVVAPLRDLGLRWM
jgi:YggT family protein